MRWFRGKGSWQTGSFLTDIISGVLDWIRNDHPQRKTIAATCPSSYYYPFLIVFRKGLKQVITIRRGFKCKYYLWSSPQVYIYRFYFRKTYRNLSLPRQQTCLKVFKYQNSNTEETKQVSLLKLDSSYITSSKLWSMRMYRIPVKRKNISEHTSINRLSLLSLKLQTSLVFL